MFLKFIRIRHRYILGLLVVIGYPFLVDEYVWVINDPTSSDVVTCAYADCNEETYDAVLTFSRGKYTFDRYIIGYNYSNLSDSEILGMIEDKDEEEHEDTDVANVASFLC